MRSSRNWKVGGKNLIQNLAFHSETAHLHFFPLFPQVETPCSGSQRAPECALSVAATC
jgi:hypothetical protein